MRKMEERGRIYHNESKKIRWQQPKVAEQRFRYINDSKIFLVYKYKIYRNYYRDWREWVIRKND